MSTGKKKIVFLSVVLIIALGCAAYGNSLNGEFIWDDEHLIEDNIYIKDGANIAQIFGKNIGAGAGVRYRFYRPLQMITYMIDYSLWKSNVQGYHLTNILLHILAALGVYCLVNIIFKDNFLSTLTAGFFVVHPIHTEVVTYISGRADSLALLFMLLCFIFYIRDAASRSMGTYIIMLVSYVFALLSRENSLILPILLLLYHHSFQKKLNMRGFLLTASLAVIYMVLRVTVLKALLADIISTTTLFQRLPGFFVAVTTYIRLLFFPFHLHMEYGSELFSWGEPKAVLGVVIFIVLLVYAFKKRENDQIVFFSITWFFLTLLPASNIYPINAYMSEHWLYLPSIGFFLIAAKAISSLYQAKDFRVAAVVFIIGLLAFYSYLTSRQNIYWREPINFYERTLKYAPESSRVYYNLGSLYKAANKNEEAIAAYKKAIEIKADYAKAYNNLGVVYASANKKEEAVTSFKKAIEIKVDYAEAYNNLGNVYRVMHKNEEAIVSYKKAIAIKPDYIKAYNSLGLVYAATHRKEEAVAAYKKAIAINPNYALAYNNLADVYFRAKQYKLAIDYCERAKELGLTNTAFLEALKPYRNGKTEIER